MLMPERSHSQPNPTFVVNGTLNLNGTWHVRWTDGVRGNEEHAERDVIDQARYIAASVPGEIHLDLMREGLLSDPYQGLGCLQARWVEDRIWSYRREFEVPEAAQHGRLWLYFERLELRARVVLNGVELCRHENAFAPLRIEITQAVRANINVLTVHMDGGTLGGLAQPTGNYTTMPDQRFHQRHWLRAPQHQYGWDWATRFVNIGITGDVTLQWSNAPALLTQVVPLVTVTADLSRATVICRVFVEGLGSSPVPGTLQAQLTELGLSLSKSVTVQPGEQCLELTFEVVEPPIWWPRGQGGQPLVHLEAQLIVAEQTVGSASARFGFRHVRVNQEALPEGGQSFIVEVNGQPVFLKGANLVPSDMIHSRADRTRFEQLLALALEANFNFLRVWGGGLYESDDFYQLCDEYGILVWQEFIFACGRYPFQNEDFYKNVKMEARFQIRRLAKHPSLIIWCGNNENEWGAWHWKFDEGVVLPDYALYHHTLPRLLTEEDGTRFYQPSSPFSPGGLDPVLDDVGDQHPWSVGMADTDFRAYRNMISRFPNEGGILGPTSLPTMLACLPEGHQHVGSFAWQVHDNAVDTWGEPSYPNAMLEQWLGLDARVLSIEDFTYWGGLVQGEGLREYIENFRRRMYRSAGAAFWMFNDCWPTTRSWTIVDYYLRRTPAFAAVKRAFAPIHVVVAQEGDDIVVFGINDTQAPRTLDLRYGVFAFTGHYHVDRSAAVTLAPNASTPIARFACHEWTDHLTSTAFAILTDQGMLIARNRLLMPLFKELVLPVPEIQIRLESGKAIFESATFAWGVCLDLQGEEALEDNFFDLYPGIRHEIPWNHEVAPQMVRFGNLSSTQKVDQGVMAQASQDASVSEQP